MSSTTFRFMDSRYGIEKIRRLAGIVRSVKPDEHRVPRAACLPVPTGGEAARGTRVLTLPKLYSLESFWPVFYCKNPSQPRPGEEQPQKAVFDELHGILPDHVVILIIKVAEQIE